MKQKILVVDDEVTLTKMVKLNLERTGNYEVKTVNVGSQAIAAALDFKPDMIFLDIMMPEMPGDEIAQSLKENAALAKIPVVFMTAIVSKEETAAMGSVIGGNKFLAKPVKTQELIKTIEETIG